ncbi:MAG: hypothetical protein QM650_13500 [Microlunatus sp.]
MQAITTTTVFGLALTLALLLRFARSRAWLFSLCHGLALRFSRPEHTAEWEREHAELWLMARRRQLTADLRRIESLLLHDDWMSATRQLGNRMARAQLMVLLARIPELLPARDRYFSYDAVTLSDRNVPASAPLIAAPVAAPAALTTPAHLADRRPSVELLDVVGW